MEYSILIGKPLLLESGENLGYITGLFLSKDLSKLCTLACADNEEEEFFLPAEAVVSAGDAVIVKSAAQSSPLGTPCPIGKAVFDEGGAFLGGAAALTDGQNGILTVCGPFGEREYPAKSLSLGSCAIVRSGKQRPPKKRSIPKEKENHPAPEKITSEVRSQEGTDYRLDLIGRRAVRDVEGLVFAGDAVTRDTLRRAHEYNRLLELAAAVLTEA